MVDLSLAATSASPASISPTEPRPRSATEAAKQFEALLIAQMMRSAHESTGASLGPDQDSTSDTMWDVAAQQFAKLLASNGGLGLAKLIQKGIQPQPFTASPAK